MKSLCPHPATRREGGARALLQDSGPKSCLVHGETHPFPSQLQKPGGFFKVCAWHSATEMGRRLFPGCSKPCANTTRLCNCTRSSWQLVDAIWHLFKIQKIKINKCYSQKGLLGGSLGVDPLLWLLQGCIDALVAQSPLPGSSRPHRAASSPVFGSRAKYLILTALL